MTPRVHTERPYDIGRVRPDGKRNIWAKRQARPPVEYGPEWVVVKVAEGWDEAIAWIRAGGEKAHA